MMTCRKVFAGVLLALAMTLLAVTPAAAGIQWCVKDPIFEIDGRVVRVQLLVPTTHQLAKVHFVLTVAEGSQARWWLPAGESLNGGSVTIVTDDDVRRDTPSLRVTGEGRRFDMRVQVSGDGLRSGPYEQRGSSKGTIVPIRLQRTGR